MCREPSPQAHLEQKTTQGAESMKMEELSSSASVLNPSGILNKRMEGTSEMLRLLEQYDHTSTSLTEPRQTNQTFLEECH